MITVEKAEKLNIDTNEVLRYLGYGKNKAEDAVLDLIEKCKAEITDACSIKACYDTFDLKIDEEKISFGNIETTSKSLMRNLKDCHKVIVFVATIGVSTDRVIRKYSMTSPSSAVVAQAVGAAMIEEWCDILCERLGENNDFLRPRFSPGYGDFPIELQEKIFELLDCPRKIGVTLTDSCLMVPSKSVSAIVGISKIDTECHKSGCESCIRTDCEYRRG